MQLHSDEEFGSSWSKNIHSWARMADRVDGLKEVFLMPKILIIAVLAKSASGR